MRSSNGRGWSDAVESLSDDTSSGRVQQWLVGVVLASLIGLYAASCLINRSATFIRIRPARLIELRGAEAIAAGAIYLSIAAFLFFHSFLSARANFQPIAYLGKVASLIGIIGGIGYLFYNVFIVG